MATAVLYGDPTDGYLVKSVSSSNWAGCLADAPSASTSDAQFYIFRSMPEAGSYLLARFFLAFDVSLYATATINSAAVHIFNKAEPVGTTTSRLYYQDWDPERTGLAADDWVSRAGLTEASADDFTPAVDWTEYEVPLTDVADVLTSNGRFLLCLADETTEPAEVNMWNFYAGDESTFIRPHLVIDYTPVGGGVSAPSVILQRHMRS